MNQTQKDASKHLVNDVHTPQPPYSRRVKNNLKEIPYNFCNPKLPGMVPSSHNIIINTSHQDQNITQHLEGGKNKREETINLIKAIKLWKMCISTTKSHSYESLESFFISEPCKTSHCSLYFLSPWRLGETLCFFFRAWTMPKERRWNQSQRHSGSSSTFRCYDLSDKRVIVSRIGYVGRA